MTASDRSAPAPADDPRPGNRGAALTALIVGIASLALIGAGVVGLAAGIVAIVFGVIALRRGQPKTQAWMGIALGALGAVVSVLVAMWLAGYVLPLMNACDGFWGFLCRPLP